MTDLFSRHLIYSFFLFLHSRAASLFFISLTSLFLAASSAGLPGEPEVLLCTVTICWSEDPAGRKTEDPLLPLVVVLENCGLEPDCWEVVVTLLPLTPPTSEIGVTIW